LVRVIGVTGYIGIVLVGGIPFAPVLKINKIGMETGIKIHRKRSTNY